MKAEVPDSMPQFMKLVDSIQWHRLTLIGDDIRLAAKEHVRRIVLAIKHVQTSHRTTLAAAYGEVHSAGIGADYDGMVIGTLLDLKSLHNSYGRESTAIYLTNMFCWSRTTLNRQGIDNPYAPLLQRFLNGHSVTMEEDEVAVLGEESVFVPTGLRIYCKVGSEFHTELIPLVIH